MTLFLRGVCVEGYWGIGFFRLGLVLVGTVALAAVLAPWVAPHDPIAGDLRNAYLQGPGGRYLLGTDTQGRDVLSRVLYGARLSLSVGLISQSVSVTLGVLLGLIAGYYGKWVDALVMRLADVTLAFPTLLLLIAVAAAVKPSLPVIFVALGALDRRVLLRHLLRNVRTQVIISATLGIAGAIMAEAALSFVGLGAQPPPSWGAMVADGRDLLRVAPWVSFAPGEAYDPRLRNER